MDIRLNSYCQCCRKEKPLSEFYRLPYDGCSPSLFCKPCTKSKFKSYLRETESEKAALWCLLVEHQVPYIASLYEECVKARETTGKNIDIFNAHLRLFEGQEHKPRGIWRSDTSLHELVYMELVSKARQKEEAQALSDEEAAYKKAQHQVWGSNSSQPYEREDYEYLNNLYESYTQNILEMDTAMEMRYRDLCRAELKKFKGEATKETTDEILKLMKLLKIDNFQETKQSETEKFIDRWAWRIENEEPAECEDLEKYKDYAGNEKMWRSILRTVQNAIAGTRNYPTIESLQKEEKAGEK